VDELYLPKSIEVIKIIIWKFKYNIFILHLILYTKLPCKY